MSNITFHKLSWLQMHRDCIELYQDKVKGIDVDVIVSIVRGGAIVSRIFSGLLDATPIANITLTSYKGIKKLSKPIITEEPETDFTGKRILIVDEVSDTGATFEVALDYFKKKKAKKIYTLAPYIKPHTTFIPDFWQKNIDAWIVFPYEIRETYNGFVKLLGTPKHAQEKMLDIGFHDWELNAVILEQSLA
jgi:hypothetical protein